MFNHKAILRTMFGSQDEPGTPKELIRQIGHPLISMTKNELFKYHKRADGRLVDRFHEVYRAFGVYCIEFPDGIYIGSVGDGCYFGRRWKLHCTSPSQTCLKERMTILSADEIVFHVLALSESENVSRFLEYAAIVQAEQLAPELLVNPKSVNDKKLRERNNRSQAARDGVLAVRDTLLANRGKQIELL